MKTKIKNGYRVFDDEKEKFVHRWVAEKKHSKEEVKGKVIHHIDGDKLNNEKSNLIILNKEDHHDLHQYQNIINMLTEGIIVFAVMYILLLLLITFKILPQEMVNVMRFSVVIILLLAFELKTGFIRGTIRNPNQKAFK